MWSQGGVRESGVHGTLHARCESHTRRFAPVSQCRPVRSLPHVWPYTCGRTRHGFTAYYPYAIPAAVWRHLESYECNGRIY